MSPARRPVKAVVVHHGTSCERRDPGERRSSIDLHSVGGRLRCESEVLSRRGPNVGFSPRACASRSHDATSLRIVLLFFAFGLSDCSYRHVVAVAVGTVTDWVMIDECMRARGWASA